MLARTAAIVDIAQSEVACAEFAKDSYRKSIFQHADKIQNTTAPHGALSDNYHFSSRFTHMRQTRLVQVTMKTLVFYIVLLVPMNALASTAAMDGNDLLEDCTSRDTGKRVHCLGYIAGVIDATLLWNSRAFSSQ